jgi:HK97 family phage major capsid protein
MPTLERTISHDHMWPASHPLAVKDTLPRATLPSHMLEGGFELKMASLGHRQQPVVVDQRGRVHAEACVFAGAYSTDPRLADYQRKMRWSARTAYARGFWAWPRFLVKANYQRELAFALMHHEMPLESKALVEGIDPSGGFLVPPDFSATVLAQLAEQSLARFASVRPCSTDVLRVPRFQPNTAYPALGTQLQPTVVGETASNQAFADVHFGVIQIPIRRFRSIVRLSKDLIADSPVALGDTLQAAFVQDVASAVTGEMLVGPDFAALTSDPSIPTLSLNPGTGHTLSATSDDGWRALRASLLEQFRQRAQVFMHGSLQAAYDGAAPGASTRPVMTRHDDVADRYLFDETPLIASAWLPAYPPANGGPVLVYGDLSQYVIAQRADVSLTLATETPAADYDELDAVLIVRLGGAVAFGAAFVVGTL